MALNVDFIVTANPPSLPAAGGSTVVTFQASTDAGDSQLQAAYSLDAGVPYVLVGPAQLPPAPVSVVPQDYPQSLTLQSTGGSAAFVRIKVQVSEVGTGAGFPRSCLVTMQLAPPAANLGASPPGPGSRQA
jgi:hypothetical protein